MLLWPLLLLVVGLVSLVVGAAMCAEIWLGPSAPEDSWWFWLLVFGAIVVVVAICWLLVLGAMWVFA